MGLKTEGIVFLFFAWGIILAFAGYFSRKFLPMKKLRKSSIDLIRRWSIG